MRVLAAATALCASIGALSAPGDLKLTLLSDKIPAASGGRCMDGSMTGYYFRQGVPDTYVIFMEGGGGCSDEKTCKRWAKTKGSSKDFAKTSWGTHYGVAVSNCSVNPYFCNTTTAVVPYCTGDTHRGNNTAASEDTWGWIFDGHANFVAIVEELVKSRGLGDAKRVLLTGSSAGGIGVLHNLEWLAARLPSADVKGAPTAGWFFPSALPGDLDDVYPPSDFPHFKAGTHGNSQTELTPGADLMKTRGLLNADCVAAQRADEWWACGSAHKLYPYLKSPVYIIENQFDTAQIYDADGQLPKKPDASEAAAVDQYVGMYGEAMRNSTAQVLQELYDEKKANGEKKQKRVRDGLFLPSCFQHPVDFTIQIMPPTVTGGAEAHGAGPQSWQLLLGDWFFEQNQLQQFHRLVESCPTDLPCNPTSECKYTAESALAPTWTISV